MSLEEATKEKREYYDRLRRDMAPAVSQYRFALEKILLPFQTTRLNEIYLQTRSVSHITRKEFQESLRLSDEQKQFAKELTVAYRLKHRRISFYDSDKRQQLKRESFAKFVDKLTPEQKQKWEKMLGEPFKRE